MKKKIISGLASGAMLFAGVMVPVESTAFTVMTAYAASQYASGAIPLTLGVASDVIDTMYKNESRVFSINVTSATNLNIKVLYIGNALAVSLYDSNDNELFSDNNSTAGDVKTYERSVGVSAGTYYLKCTTLENGVQGQYQVTVEAGAAKKSIKDSSVTVSGINAKYTYTGYEIKPKPIVKDGTKTLTEGVDYTLSYENNVNLGPKNADNTAAEVTITGTGSYSGQRSVSFTITAPELKNIDISKAEVNGINDEYAFTGSKIQPKPTSVVLNGTTLVEGTDYQVRYPTASTANIEGTGTVTIKGIGNYINSVVKTFTIISTAKTDLSTAKVNLEKYSYAYTGKKITPPITSVVLNGKTLSRDTDYTVSYGTNINGSGTVTVTAQTGSDYSGSATATFTINKANISDASVILDDTTLVYTGSEMKPAVKSVVLNGTTLTSGTDYTVSYKNNVSAGTGSVVITGTGNYEGSMSIDFTIVCANISGAAVTLENTSYTYTGSEIKPAVKSVVLNGKTLAAADYEVSYSNNKNVGTGTVTVKGKGNYTGSKSVTFTINSKNTSIDISGAAVTLENTSYTYTGSEIKPAVKSVVLNGKTLAATDYEVSYSNNKNVGTGTVTVKGKGNYTGSKSVTFTINKQAVTRIPGDVNDDGKVNMQDLTRLQQKLAEWDVTINTSNAEVTGDGKINMQDLTRLQQKLAEWDVELL